MIKTLIFDADGVVIKREMYFSERLSRDFDIPLDSILPFFRKEFQKCLIGQADLKEELARYLPVWNWGKSIDDLLEFWFSNESQTDNRILADVKNLRQNGISCYLATVNEKYRTEYLWSRLDLRNHFEGIFSSAAIGHKKSSSDFWPAVFPMLNTLNKKMIFVWDDEKEVIAAAQSFGFFAELYTDFDTYKNKMNSLLV